MGITFGPNEMIFGAILLAVLFLAFFGFKKKPRTSDAPGSDTVGGEAEVVVDVPPVEPQETNAEVATELVAEPIVKPKAEKASYSAAKTPKNVSQQ